jgi:hypothetical protein
MELLNNNDISRLMFSRMSVQFTKDYLEEIIAYCYRTDNACGQSQSDHFKRLHLFLSL